MSLADFNPGRRYADYKSGTDRTAAYGIGALVAGKLAAKAGLFKLILAAPTLPTARARTRAACKPRRA